MIFAQYVKFLNKLIAFLTCPLTKTILAPNMQNTPTYLNPSYIYSMDFHLVLACALCIAESSSI